MRHHWNGYCSLESQELDSTFLLQANWVLSHYKSYSPSLTHTFKQVFFSIPKCFQPNSHTEMDALGVQYLAQEYFDIHTGRERDLKLPKAIYIFPIFFPLFLHITLHNFFYASASAFLLLIPRLLVCGQLRILDRQRWFSYVSFFKMCMFSWVRVIKVPPRTTTHI